MHVCGCRCACVCTCICYSPRWGACMHIDGQTRRSVRDVLLTTFCMGLKGNSFFDACQPHHLQTLPHTSHPEGCFLSMQTDYDHDPRERNSGKMFRWHKRKTWRNFGETFCWFSPLNFQQKWPQEISRKILHIFHEGRNNILSRRDSGSGRGRNRVFWGVGVVEGDCLGWAGVGLVGKEKDTPKVVSACVHACVRACVCVCPLIARSEHDSMSYTISFKIITRTKLFLLSALVDYSYSFRALRINCHYSYSFSVLWTRIQLQEISPNDFGQLQLQWNNCFRVKDVMLSKRMVVLGVKFPGPFSSRELCRKAHIVGADLKVDSEDFHRKRSENRRE